MCTNTISFLVKASALTSLLGKITFTRMPACASPLMMWRQRRRDEDIMAQEVPGFQRTEIWTPAHHCSTHWRVFYHIKKMCCSLLLIPLFIWGKRSESINALSSYSPLRNAASLLQKSLRAEEMHYVFFFFCPLPDVKSSLLLLRTSPRIVALCDAFKGVRSLPESPVLSHFNGDLIITISVIRCARPSLKSLACLWCRRGNGGRATLLFNT